MYANIAIWLKNSVGNFYDLKSLFDNLPLCSGVLPLSCSVLVIDKVDTPIWINALF